MFTASDGTAWHHTAAARVHAVLKSPYTALGIAASCVALAPLVCRHYEHQAAPTLERPPSNSSGAR